MSRREWLLRLGAVLLLAAPLDAVAQRSDPLRERLGSTDFTLAADEVSYDRNTDVYEATGSVHVEQSDGRTLTTDWLVFNGTTRVGVASGNVRLLDASDTMVAEFMAVDLRTMVALATNASLDTPTPGFTVEGATLQRTGLDTYEMERATFTTCRCPGNAKPRPWELEVQDARIEIGGYAVGRDLKLKAMGFPVFYLPWIMFPAKTERQTGFLLPSLTISGRNGTEIETPFFVTLGDAANLTLSPQYISKRGLKGAAELEYVFGERDEGRIGAAGLRGDDEVDDHDVDTPFSDDRWAYWWKHDQKLTPHARLGTELVGISDNQYVLDFDDLPRNLRNSRFLESMTFASYADAGLYAGIETLMFDDLQSPNDLDRDDFVLHRLPDLRFSQVPQPLGFVERSVGKMPLRFGFDTRFTNFHQTDGKTQILGNRAIREQFFDTGRDALFDGQEPIATGATNPNIDVNLDNLFSVGSDQSEGDGFYQEGELLADRGQRFDVYPNVSLPQRLGFLETLSEVGYRETLYFPDAGDNESRGIWTGRFDVRTRLAKSLTFRSLPMRHVVEPMLAFAFVSAPSQSRNPLFLPTSSVPSQRLIDGDIRLLTRDPTDRVPDQRRLQLQVGNRFYGPSREGGTAPTLLGELRIGSGYDFEESNATRIFANGLVRPLADLELAFNVGWDPDESHLNDVEASVIWDAQAGHLVQLRYRYLRDPVVTFENFRVQDDIFDDFDDSESKVSQLDLNLRAVVSRNLEVFGDGFVSFTSSSSSAGGMGFQLSSDCRCWDLIAQIEQRTRPSETRFSLELRLAGLGQRSPGSRHERSPNSRNFR